MHTGETWRLGHRPALDGLRGIAVLLVVVSHMSEARLRPLGMSGVVVFFALSGFLITSQLVEEHTDKTRVNLLRFWKRRALRLLPAAVVCVIVVTLFGLASPSEAVGPLTYSANWRMAAGVGSNGALAHTWSLAIEEQFYFVWPMMFLLLVRFGNAVLVAGLGSALACSVTLRMGEANASAGWARVYYGTDTRADALLLGCLLAVAFHARAAPGAAPRGVVPLALTTVVATGAHANARFVLVWLPLIVALCTVVVLWGSMTTYQRRLEGAWLRATGRVSYGLYLWHWPVFFAFRRWGFDGWGLFAALPIVAVLTWTSWRWVEQPALGLRRRVNGHSGSARHVPSVEVDPARDPLATPGGSSAKCREIVQPSRLSRYRRPV